MYVDKLTGRYQPFYDAKAAERKREQGRIPSEMDNHERADRSYVDLGVKLLELAATAPRLFRANSNA